MLSQALLASVLLHLFALYWLRHGLPMTSGAAQARPALEIHLTPSRSAPAAPAASIPAPARRLPAAADKDKQMQAPLPVPERHPVPSSAEMDASVAGSLLESAKRDVGKIVRELRKDFPALRAGEGQGTATARLERAIAAAGLPSGSAMQEVTAPDGRRMTKVIGATGTYCVYGRRSGAGIAESELAAMVVGTCPR
ncbi:MAG TPA: hypothetical protein VEC01_10035 [Noviherbaspirillum sp.]|uniref:hypothetical protein n=1 Tax=Noviherbaspirillum sp. TaxID=1926288 RepID=UPI002D2D8AAA|nr:hypothetical protein [Noviherbaspirillum sp.]HYD95652.1 hypothetical protein [Noviherbaspirillum sp.]